MLKKIVGAGYLTYNGSVGQYISGLTLTLTSEMDL